MDGWMWWRSEDIDLYRCVFLLFASIRYIQSMLAMWDKYFACCLARGSNMNSPVLHTYDDDDDDDYDDVDVEEETVQRKEDEKRTNKIYITRNHWDLRLYSLFLRQIGLDLSSRGTYTQHTYTHIYLQTYIDRLNIHKVEGVHLKGRVNLISLSDHRVCIYIFRGYALKLLIRKERVCRWWWKGNEK